MIDKLRDYGLRGDVFFAVGVIAILMLLFVPIPATVLDVLIILNISFALLILLLTFYSERPLDFSTLPSVLLLATLFRLGLNIASTRLILTDGNAGKVISAVGSYVVAGNYVIGLVIFFILVVVQFLVVTNGAQRVAEVTARFTLDSMPGKQMSIDADLNMGIIDEKQAQERRAYIEKEANFYGAMDGATKFVKGDAIASIIIILINIIGGLAIGVAQAGLPWQQALHIYTLQTVGDGIVTQIPSLIIAVGTGIIITRAATQGNLADQLFGQIVTHPFTLTLVAVVISSAAFLPGLPSLTLILVGITFALFGYFAHKKKQLKLIEKTFREFENTKKTSTQESLLQVAFSSPIWPQILAEETEIQRQFSRFKSEFESKYGLFLPELLLKAESVLKADEYSIRLSNIEFASGVLHPDKMMVIDPQNKLDKKMGLAAVEPAYGLNALWVDADKAKDIKQGGMTVVEPISVLMTHITEFVKSHSAEFVTRQFVDQLVAEQREINEVLVSEVIPTQLAIADVQQIFTHLVQEKVCLHNANHIFEVLADKARHEKDVQLLTEFVRQRLRNQLTSLLLDNDRTLNIISIAPLLERALLNGAANVITKGLQISPTDLDSLVKQAVLFVEKAISLGAEPVLLVNPTIRRPLWQLLNRTVPLLHVISVNEVPHHIKLNSLGVIQAYNQQVA